ncbi:MAG TPA: NrfD/PsrC family molybdoenzyme membrane anchor subunit [Desulfosporosinus sp.]|nr:NrfD/PsrC family molybdoenzyme membrane anchor subunit [Desulfosporosinus sp.]
MEHWGWLIAIYLFLGGLGAGAYLTSFAAEKGFLGGATNLNRVGYYVSAPIVGFGALLLVTDLGQGLRKPWLILGMFANLNSVMTWGIYIVSAFIFVALATAYFVWKKKQAPKLLTYIGAVLALSTAAYTGMLLAVVEAVPFWHSYLMPVLFVISAMSTGLALTSMLAYFFEKQQVHEERVSQLHLLLVGAEIIIIAAFFALIYFGGQGSVAIESANRIVIGSLAWPFWVLLVVGGLLGPMLIFFVQQFRRKRQKGVAQNEDMTVQVEQVTEGNPKSQGALILLDVAVIAGGLTLRCVIIFAALPVWNGFLR